MSIVIAVMARTAVVATASIVRYPNPPFCVGVVAWMPVAKLISAIVVVDRPATVDPRLHGNIVVMAAASAAVVSMTRTVMDRCPTMVIVVVIIQYGSYD